MGILAWFHVHGQNDQPTHCLLQAFTGAVTTSLYDRARDFNTAAKILEILYSCINAASDLYVVELAVPQGVHKGT